MDVPATLNPRRKARVIRSEPVSVIRNWLSLAVNDFRQNLTVSLVYGAGLSVLGWIGALGLYAANLAWMILPLAAGAMLLGPVVTVGLYRISRRQQGNGGTGVAAPGQIFLVSVVMMVLLLSWVRAATLLFAVFFGLRPFAGAQETLLTLFTTAEGVALFLVGSFVGGLFAAFGYAISVFSFPMLVHRDIDGFSAMGLSFNATTQNFRLLILWAVIVSGLVAVGLVTGLIGLIPIFPILGYATWHAYWDLFEEQIND